MGIFCKGKEEKKIDVSVSVKQPEIVFCESYKDKFKKIYYEKLTSKYIDENLVHQFKSYGFYNEWEICFRYQDLEEWFLEKHYYKYKEDRIWDLIYHQKLSESFINKHIEDLIKDYSTLVNKQRLSEDIINKYFHLFLKYKKSLIIHQTLSEKIIKDNLEKFDKKLILAYQQHLSKELLVGIGWSDREKLITLFRKYCSESNNVEHFKNEFSIRGKMGLHEEYVTGLGYIYIIKYGSIEYNINESEYIELKEFFENNRQRCLNKFLDLELEK